MIKATLITFKSKRFKKAINFCFVASVTSVTKNEIHLYWLFLLPEFKKIQKESGLFSFQITTTTMKIKTNKFDIWFLVTG